MVEVMSDDQTKLVKSKDMRRKAFFCGDLTNPMNFFLIFCLCLIKVRSNIVGIHSCHLVALVLGSILYPLITKPAICFLV